MHNHAKHLLVYIILFILFQIDFRQKQRYPVSTAISSSIVQIAYIVLVKSPDKLMSSLGYCEAYKFSGMTAYQLLHVAMNNKTVNLLCQLNITEHFYYFNPL